MTMWLNLAANYYVNVNKFLDYDIIIQHMMMPCNKKVINVISNKIILEEIFAYSNQISDKDKSLALMWLQSASQMGL